MLSSKETENAPLFNTHHVKPKHLINIKRSIDFKKPVLTKQQGKTMEDAKPLAKKRRD